MSIKITSRVSVITLVLVFSMAITTGSAYSWEFAPEEWVDSWECLGPFDNSDDKGIEKDWLANVGGEKTPNINTPDSFAKIKSDYPSIERITGKPLDVGIVDFQRIFGPHEKTVAYAWSEIECPTQGFSLLKIGSDDGAKVWLNGQEIFNYHVHRGAQPDDEKIPVRLLKGRNLCVLKVEQGDQAWGFYLRFGVLTPEIPGMRLRPVVPVQPPAILLGSALPIRQDLFLSLRNCGSVDLEDVRVLCASDALKDATSDLFSCKIGQVVDVTLTLEPKADLQPGKALQMQLDWRGKKGNGEKFAIAETSSSLVHPLLRTRTERSDAPFSIIQLTDPHIVHRDSVLLGVKTAERLEQAVEEINALDPQPDLMIVTGDLLLNNSDGYALFHEIVSKLKMPCLTTFGNHDKPDGLAKAARVFSEWGLPPYYALIHRGYEFIVLDPVARVDPPYGEFPKAEMDWVEGLLSKSPEPPVLFFLHHDLFSGAGVPDPKPVQKVLESYPGEEWFFYGHWHADCFYKRLNQRHVVSAAIGYLFDKSNLPHDRNLPGYRLIDFDKGRITTRFKPFGQPFMSDPPVEEYLTTVPLPEK